MDGAVSHDAAVRMAAFRFLEAEVEKADELTLPLDLLRRGFEFEGRRVPLLGPQGIFKPAVLAEFPLSITTAPPSARKPAPYDDVIEDDDLLRYRYRGTDPMHRDNVSLRRSMVRRIPLIYLRGIVPGRYLPVWPAYVVEDHPQGLTFTVEIDERSVAWTGEPAVVDRTAEIRRSYATRVALDRIHQGRFRERVLEAYRECCAVCRLRHRELLDATHILPDKHPKGEPVVSNGLALCKLHHAAYDRNILGIRPDLKIAIRSDILAEIDGPMLRYGLQGLQGTSLMVIPKRNQDRPNPVFLEERFDEFQSAG